MRIGWLADDPGYIGGAELTQAEFRAAAPKGVEIVDCPPGGVVPGLDRYVVHSHMTYSNADLDETVPFPTVRYFHDVRPQRINPDTAIFCSPLQSAKMKRKGELVPPAVDLERFRPSRQTKRNTERQGAVAIGAWMNPGKGQRQLDEWSRKNDTLLTVYGNGPYVPTGPNIDYRGALAPDEVPEILWQHETFVHLPTLIEPFGRAVVEAWAAGCKLVVNRLVGARHWIEKEPQKLNTAAEDFWAVACG